MSASLVAKKEFTKHVVSRWMPWRVVFCRYLRGHVSAWVKDVDIERVHQAEFDYGVI